jgi:DNA-binding MarR family transcriptional regulator
MSVTADAVSVGSLPAATVTPVAHVTPYAALMDEADNPDDLSGLVAAWRSISACHARTCAVLERELGERHGLGVSDFEVLARLAEAAEHKFRAQDLADAVHLSQSALSRLVDRLARHGLVQRFTCDMDRRGIYVQLTEAGQQRFAEAEPTHLDILRRTLPGGAVNEA